MMFYPSKRDWWLSLLIGAACLFIIGNGIYALFMEQFILGLLLVMFGPLILWPYLTTRYEFTATDLVLRSGPFRWRIPLDAIVEVFPSRNPLSAPACSLDRLRINFRKKNGRMAFALVSPKDKQGFLRELADRVPGVQVAENRV